jgi:mRNA-degrading endonuclease toxin of MazEF toxin-antitoxin module
LRLVVGDLWWTWVPYNDRARAGKDRPVVILGWSRASLVDDSVVLVVPVTSFDSVPKPKAGDIEIKNLKQAGLNKPSWVRARRVFNVVPAALDRSRGAIGFVGQDEMAAIYTELASLLRPGGARRGAT